MKNQIIKKEDKIKALTPLNMLKRCIDIKTVADVVKTDAMALSQLRNDLGKDSLLALLELHIWSLNESMNLNNKLSEFQVQEIATEILSIYYYLKVEDIYLIFRRAKRGEFGKVYGSLSMIDIFGWFEKYNEERTTYYINQNIENRHNDPTERTSEKDEKSYHIAKLIYVDKKNNKKNE